MSTTWKKRAALGLGAALVATVGFTAAAQAAPFDPTPATTQLTQQQADDMRYLRDEERLAHEVYVELGKLYPDARVFSNIARSETRHFEAVGRLLDRYGVDDPSEGLPPGDYAFDHLDELYEELMDLGDNSLADAYKVGITIEEEDITDLEKFIKNASTDDVKQVYGNLLAGSENHLKAFTAASEGKAVGAGNGQGMQNGRGGNGNGHGMQNCRGGNGQGGNGQGGQGNGTYTQAEDCPCR